MHYPGVVGRTGWCHLSPWIRGSDVQMLLPSLLGDSVTFQKSPVLRGVAISARSVDVAMVRKPCGFLLPPFAFNVTILVLCDSFESSLFLPLLSGSVCRNSHHLPGTKNIVLCQL